MKSPPDSKRHLWILLAIAVCDLFLWRLAFAQGASGALAISFLDVGQGDSALIEVPLGSRSAARVLIDAGPHAAVMTALAKVLPAADRRIDLLLQTHPQLDHYGGFVDVLASHRISAFLGTGRKGETSAYEAIPAMLAERKVPYVRVAEGDRIRIGETVLEVLAPSRREFVDGELNNTSLVTLLRLGEFEALFTGDIGESVEDRLARDYDIRADVLKVAHHGSRFSSSEAFLAEAAPAVAVIGVGADNRYGHPTEQTLDRLASVGARVFRTDQNGTVRVVVGERGMKVFVEKK